MDSKGYSKNAQAPIDFVVIIVIISLVAIAGGKVFGPTLTNTLTTASNKIDLKTASLVDKTTSPNQAARLQNTTASNISDEPDSSSYTQLALNPQTETLNPASSSALQPTTQIASSLAASNTQPRDVVYSPAGESAPPASYRTNNISNLSNTTELNNAIAATSTATVSSSAGTSLAISGSGAAYSDAYWTSQPPAVQALRYMDPDLREAKATELAHQGYTIDVPIMVWNWDPQKTMELRGQYGYTWVPSALQPNITIAPGLTVPGMQSYDPNHPPTGSIAVPQQFQTGSSSTTTSATTSASTATVSSSAGTSRGNAIQSSATDTTSRSATEASRSSSGRSR